MIVGFDSMAGFSLTGKLKWIGYYICSKHFIGGNRLIKEHPDPILATAVHEQVYPSIYSVSCFILLSQKETALNVFFFQTAHVNALLFK